MIELTIAIHDTSDIHALCRDLAQRLTGFKLPNGQEVEKIDVGEPGNAFGAPFVVVTSKIGETTLVLNVTSFCAR